MDDEKLIKIIDLKKANQKIDFFKFSDCTDDLSLTVKKINFIYANNGVGKTSFSELLGTYDGIELFSFNNTFLEESNKMLVSKNIAKIKSLEKEKNSLFLKASIDIGKIVISSEFSTNDPKWKNHVKPFLEELEVEKEILNLISSKSEMKNQIVKSCEQLLKINKYFMDNKMKNLYIKRENFNINIKKDFKGYKYEELKILKTGIMDRVKKLKKELKIEVFEEFKNENIDINVLEKIYNEVCKIEKMNYCYICSSEIRDFSQTKQKMFDKINQLKEKYMSLFENETLFQKWKEVFQSDISCQDLKDYQFDIILKTINDDFESYQILLFDFMHNLTYFFDDSNIKKIDRISELIEESNKLEQDKILSKIEEKDLNFILKILNDLIGIDRIKCNKKNQNFIEIETNNGELPFSSGEQKIIRFVFNLLFFVSTTNKKFLVLDELEDSLDGLSRINIAYIIKLFFFEYKVTFVIFTHNYLLIKELWDSGVKGIKLSLFCKNADGLRQIYNIADTDKTAEQIKFLGLKSGIDLLKNKIRGVFSIPKEYSEKTILFLYIIWLLRVNQMIWNKSNEGENHLIFDILKHDFILNSNIKDKEITFKENMRLFSDFIGLEREKQEWISYDLFLKQIESLYNKLDFEPKCLFKNENFSIIENNINNLIKILILREKIRKFIDDKIDEINNKGWSYWKKINFLEEKRIINFEAKRFLNYALNFLDTYYHNEISPSLLLAGIEVNTCFIDNMIHDFEKISINPK